MAQIERAVLSRLTKTDGNLGDTWVVQGIYADGSRSPVYEGGSTFDAACAALTVIPEDTVLTGPDIDEPVAGDGGNTGLASST